MVLGLGARDRAGARLGAEGRHHGRVRIAALDRRHRSRNRPGPADPGHSRRCPTASTSRCWPWACSASPRSCAISRTRKPATSSRARSAGCCHRCADLRRCVRPDPARDRPRLPARHPARQRRRARRRSPPIRWKRSSPTIPRASARARSRAWPARRAANNAGAQTSFIPLLTLGIPPNAVMALMVGAMTIHGIIPGPAGDDQEPEPVLGDDRLDVDRQPDAADHQPAADRAVGAPAEGALPPDVHRPSCCSAASASTRSTTIPTTFFHRVLRRSSATC